MTAPILQQLLRRSSSDFVRVAREHGLPRRVAEALESSAHELHSENPRRIFESRKHFEETAMHAVIGDAGNLELSYGLVDALATAVETLGLARESDVPDPFRRVWISNSSDERHRGVVLRCERGEVAVFCPPNQDLIAETGGELRFSYRGFASSVAYGLCLNDAVRLPGALVLHLNRPEDEGAIGRDNRRYPVSLPAVVRALGDLGTPEWSEPRACEVLDVSAGGMRIASDLPFGPNHAVEIEVQFPDGEPEPALMTGIVCWNREDPEVGRSQGLEFEGLLPKAASRYERFLQTLTE